MYQLKVKGHFDAAHQLDDYVGKCHNLHGHRWDVEACLQGKKLDKLNMLIDFSVVKSAMKDIFDLCLDHAYLNESITVRNPTAEFLAQWLYWQLCTWLPVSTVKLVSVTVWESPECSVTYSYDEGSRDVVVPLSQSAYKDTSGLGAVRLELMKIAGGK